MYNYRQLILLSFCCSLVLLSSCRQDDKSAPAVAAIDGQSPLLKAEVVRGPFAFRILVDKEKIDITENFTVTLAAEAEEGYTCEFPKFGSGLEPFAIVDYHTAPPRLNEKQKMLYCRTYVLEPMLSEKYQIPAQKVIFQERGGEGRKYELETEPFDLEVLLPPPDFWEKLDIDVEAGMEPQQSLGPEPRSLVWLYTVAALLLVAGLVLLYWHRRRGQQEAVPVIPPHITALQALQALIDEDLLKKQQIKLFYNRISGILRTYIEGRFCLRAPEQTTEEFLADLAVADSLIQEHKQLLQNFLIHCDLVKFAAYLPAEQEIQNTFSACKTFISQTMQE